MVLDIYSDLDEAHQDTRSVFWRKLHLCLSHTFRLHDFGQKRYMYLAVQSQWNEFS